MSLIQLKSELPTIEANIVSFLNSIKSDFYIFKIFDNLQTQDNQRRAWENKQREIIENIRELLASIAPTFLDEDTNPHMQYYRVMYAALSKIHNLTPAQLQGETVFRKLFDAKSAVLLYLKEMLESKIRILVCVRSDIDLLRIMWMEGNNRDASITEREEAATITLINMTGHTSLSCPALEKTLNENVRKQTKQLKSYIEKALIAVEASATSSPVADEEARLLSNNDGGTIAVVLSSAVAAAVVPAAHAVPEASSSRLRNWI